MQVPHSKISKQAGFSLMELIIVVVIIGIIAGFALTNYDRAKQRNEERRAAALLRSVAGKVMQDKARNGTYFDTSGTAQSETDIDNALGTTLSADTPDLTFTFDTRSPDSFAIFVSSVDYGYNARIDVNNTPCCFSGTCRSLPACTCVSATFTVCDQRCVDNLSDREFCGDCSTSCSDMEECINGACVDNFNN